MNKALHALVYVILAVAGVALFFEIKLFDKKELLTERNDQLIQSLIDVAGTVEEANAPKPTSQPEARKDVSPIEAKAIETPDTENVLDEYHSELEAGNNKTLQWDGKRAQLRVLYQLDGEGNKIPDPGRPGSFVKTGSGTAQELLDQLFERAKAQRANLDTTRAELQNLRRKIETLVADYNKLPPIMRQDKETIVKHEGTIADLEQQKQAVEEQLKKTKAQVDDLQAEIASLKDEVTNAKEETEAVKEDLAKAEKAKEQLIQLLKKQAASQSVASSGAPVTTLPAGDKGKLVYVNNDLMFAVVEFTDEAMQELLGPERQNPLPPLEMGVRRKGANGGKDAYVGHIRLRQVTQGKNYVLADILRDWEQLKAAKDDVVSAE